MFCLSLPISQCKENLFNFSFYTGTEQEDPLVKSQEAQAEQGNGGFLSKIKKLLLRGLETVYL